MDDINELKLSDEQKPDALNVALCVADAVLKRTYLSDIGGTFPVDKYKADVPEKSAYHHEISQKVRFCKISKIVLKKGENIRESIVSVFKSVSHDNSSLLFLIKGNESSVDFYVGVRSDKDVDVDVKELASTLTGCFPGSKEDVLRASNFVEAVLPVFQKNDYVSAVSGIPALRIEKESEREDNKFVQGLEKFIDAMAGKKYAMLVIAESRKQNDIETSRRALEHLYSQLAPYAGGMYSYGENESDSVNTSMAKGTSDAISQSISNSLTHTTGVNDSKTITRTNTFGLNAGVNLNKPLDWAWTPLGIGKGSKMLGLSLGGFASHSKSVGETHGTSSSVAEGKITTDGSTKTISFTATEGFTRSLGKSHGYQINFENHAIQKLQGRIEKQLTRYDQCADLGMWNSAAYFLAESPDVARMAASTYQSLICGKDSSLENNYIIDWGKSESTFVKSYLMRFEHPVFEYEERKVTPGTLVSTFELAIQAGFPTRSVPGLPILEMAELGRSVSIVSEAYKGDSVGIGKVSRFGEVENVPVFLDVNSIASHVFVTGSTGSGKSNAIYGLLKMLYDKKIPFLVIEPAKGEYKDVLGTDSHVRVFGTNSKLTPLLRINPFSFPAGIHVMEHIDRLIEILNAVWPMYAAMPAILKDAVEQTYEKLGWDLTTSECRYGADIFPDFHDLLSVLPLVISRSGYSEEVKSNYVGSLVTRVRSLTNGYFRGIFRKEENSAEELFEGPCIIDISRVGATETKALLMGVLFQKLQEWRMANAGFANSGLRHVTVLEEAHDLLRKTSVEQNAESSNLQGKSVEMITNAIAEMRTYGEGFIIADQAPGLLDPAVIRNTNTKIVFRLPDYDDRVMVGKAQNLDEDQINELARMKTGCAAVYQNNWLEAVLCQFPKFGVSGAKYGLKGENVNLDGRGQADALWLKMLLLASSCLRTGRELNLECVDDPSRHLLIRYYPAEFSDLAASHFNGREIEDMVYRMVVKPAISASPRIGYGRKEWTERFISELHQVPMVCMVYESGDMLLIDELHRIVFLSFKGQELQKAKDNPEAIEFWDANLLNIERWRMTHVYSTGGSC